MFTTWIHRYALWNHGIGGGGGCQVAQSPLGTLDDDDIPSSWLSSEPSKSPTPFRPWLNVSLPSFSQKYIFFPIWSGVWVSGTLHVSSTHGCSLQLSGACCLKNMILCEKWLAKEKNRIIIVQCCCTYTISVVEDNIE